MSVTTVSMASSHFAASEQIRTTAKRRAVIGACSSLKAMLEEQTRDDEFIEALRKWVSESGEMLQEREVSQEDLAQQMDGLKEIVRTYGKSESETIRSTLARLEVSKKPQKQEEPTKKKRVSFKDYAAKLKQRESEQEAIFEEAVQKFRMFGQMAKSTLDTSSEIFARQQEDYLRQVKAQSQKIEQLEMQVRTELPSILNEINSLSEEREKIEIEISEGQALKEELEQKTKALDEQLVELSKRADEVQKTLSKKSSPWKEVAKVALPLVVSVAAAYLLPGSLSVSGNLGEVSIGATISL